MILYLTWLIGSLEPDWQPVRDVNGGLVGSEVQREFRELSVSMPAVSQSLLGDGAKLVPAFSVCEEIRHNRLIYSARAAY